jgi:hypothetical protein
MSESPVTVNVNADWTMFNPHEYLDMWYTVPTPEITATLSFLRSAYSKVPPAARVIDFCCGPTIYQYMAPAPRVAELHGADFLQQNLEEIQRWRDAQPEAHDWTAIIAEALRLEGNAAPTPSDIAQRAAMMRQKLTRLDWCDVRQPHPFGKPTGRAYDVVSNCYGTDVVANTLEEWNEYLGNCCSVLKPGGLLIMTLIKEAQWWPSGDLIMPALALNEGHVTDALTRLGFIPGSIEMVTEAVEDASEAGYSDIIFVTATLGADVA